MHRPALYTFLGADLTQIHGSALHCAATHRRVRRRHGQMADAKHFHVLVELRWRPATVSGGRLLSSKTRAPPTGRPRCPDRRREYRPDPDGPRRLLSASRCPIGKAKAVTATARKLAILFYNALRFGLAYRPRAPRTVKSATDSVN